jgi:hypothetical protein
MDVITVTRRTAAKPEANWGLWADVPNRTRWDDALQRITIVVRPAAPRPHPAALRTPPIGAAETVVKPR